MTKNWIFLEAEIRGESTYEHFLKAKSIDGVKKKFNKWIDKICKDQNKKKGGCD